MKKLTKIYRLTESPFNSQIPEPSPTVAAGGVSQRVTRPDVRRKLDQVENLLDSIRDGGTGNPELEKIVNKFLVDIIPFMEG